MINNDIIDDFYEKASSIGIYLTKEIIDKFFIYKNLLLEWNEYMNLTAITSDRDILTKHFLDSLTIIKSIPEGANILDVGTGAGFPGIPLALVRPDLKITLMDATKKKLSFLKTVIQDLILNNVSLVHARAEDAGRSAEYREKYNVVISRAVASLPLLSEYCLPFVMINGAFIAMKGPNVLNEVKMAIDIITCLGGEFDKVDSITLTDENDEKNERTIIMIKKIRHTPIKYPRNSAELSKLYKK